MPLKPCRECGAEVSAQAATCPKCGIKGPGDKRTVRKSMGCFGWIFIVLGIAIVASILGSKSPDDDRDRTSE
jgi:ribosomal protein L40E